MSSPAASSALSRLCRANLGILSQKLGLMKVLRSKHGNGRANEFYSAVCPLIKASIGQHIRHSMDHMELAVRLAVTPVDFAELHYDLRQRGGDDEHNMDKAEQRIRGVSDLLHKLDSNNIVVGEASVRLHPVAAYFMLSGDDGTEYALTSTIGREMAFSAHHAIHHMALIKIIATQSAGLSDDDLPEGFGRAPSTIRFDIAGSS